MLHPRSGILAKTISMSFLISSRQDWVNRLSKSWMLDYSLYKIIYIDVPLGSYVY